jgi:hypothetical protein
MAKLIEHGLSFTEQRPHGSHKLGKRAVVIGAGSAAWRRPAPWPDTPNRSTSWSATGWRQPPDRAPARRRIGTHMACLPAVFARSIRFSPVSRAVLSQPALYPSRSR